MPSSLRRYPAGSDRNNAGASALPLQDPYRRPRSFPRMYPANNHLIRLAGDADEAALERLAQLDSSRPLQHPVLVAEIRGQVAAALDMDERRAIADPFQPTAILRAQLQAR